MRGKERPKRPVKSWRRTAVWIRAESDGPNLGARFTFTLPTVGETGEGPAALDRWKLGLGLEGRRRRAAHAHHREQAAPQAGRRRRPPCLRLHRAPDGLLDAKGGTQG